MFGMLAGWSEGGGDDGYEIYTLYAQWYIGVFPWLHLRLCRRMGACSSRQKGIRGVVNTIKSFFNIKIIGTFQKLELNEMMNLFSPDIPRAFLPIFSIASPHQYRKGMIQKMGSSINNSRPSGRTASIQIVHKRRKKNFAA